MYLHVTTVPLHRCPAMDTSILQSVDHMGSCHRYSYDYRNRLCSNENTVEHFCHLCLVVHPPMTVYCCYMSVWEQLSTCIGWPIEGVMSYRKACKLYFNSKMQTYIKIHIIRYRNT